MAYCPCHCHLLSQVEEGATLFYVVSADSIKCVFSLHDNVL